MRHIRPLLLALASVLLLAGCKDSEESMEALTDRVFTLAQSQYPILVQGLQGDKTPRTVD